jgi:hypothetical protein
MATETRTLTVHDRAELDSTVTGYISQGFVVAQQTEMSVTMFKKRSFDIGKYFRGLIMCIVPGVLYLLRYTGEKNEMVIINIEPTPAV